MIKSKHIVSSLTRDDELTAGLALKYNASNPNGYETPAELNARDVANKARGNHTGDQLASTISDFGPSVRGTILSGISFLTATAVTAADNILVAIGKLQALITGLQSSKYDASNPSSYETTTQLNARDTANRARANHTGTIVSSVVSDFAATVLATILTGLSVATSSAITAADSVLVALGKLQAQLNTRAVSTIASSTGTANTAGTSTAHARADHVHNTVLTSDRIYQTASANTSGTGFTTISSFSITPAAGSWIFDYNIVNAASTNNTTITAAIFKNGVQITDSNMSIMVRSGARDMLSGGCPEQTADGTDVFDVKVSASTGTVTCSNRIFKGLRVG